MRERLDISVERVPHNGHVNVSAMVNGYRVRRTYIGYSKREAVAMFRDEVNGENGNA